MLYSFVDGLGSNSCPQQMENRSIFVTRLIYGGSHVCSQ